MPTTPVSPAQRATSALVERYKGTWYGKADLAKRQGAARRTATACSSFAAEFGKLQLLTDAEQATLNAAAALLNRAGKLLEVAARAAAKAQQQHRAEMNTRLDAKARQTCEQAYPNAGLNRLCAEARLMLSFCGAAGGDWARGRTGSAYRDTPSNLHPLQSAVLEAEHGGDQPLLLQTAIGHWLTEANERGYPTRTLLMFQQFCADQRPSPDRDPGDEHPTYRHTTFPSAVHA